MKNKSLILCIISWGLFFNFTEIQAQKPLNPIQDNGLKSRIELIRADSLVGENSISRTQTFLGNVIFLHRGVKLGCDKAIHNQSSNFIEAYGKIIINQGDTLTIVGDTLLYDGNTRFARVYGKQVILRDKKVTLRTTKIFYDLNRDQAYYPVPGAIQQDSSKLSSKEGYYNTKTKYFRYIGDVEIINPNYVLCTDSLDYDTYSKQAIFKTYTTIKSKNGDLSAYKGKYNIKTKVSAFEGRAKVSNVDYSLEGDTLNFDNIKSSGTAKGNVVFVSFKDSLIVVGNKGIRTGEIGLTKIIGNTISQRVAKNDTLLIASDTLWVFEKNKNQKPDSIAIDSTINISVDSLSISNPIDSLQSEVDLKQKINPKPNSKIPVGLKNTVEKEGNVQNIPSKIKKRLKVPIPADTLITPPKTEILIAKSDSSQAKTDSLTSAPKRADIEKIIADGNVEVFRTDFQSLSDSLVYDLKDSLIHFFSKPIIWNQENQLEADTIIITLKNNRLKLMELLQNSFVIEVDTVKNFNQIKGRVIYAFFDEKSELKTIKVEGNGESKYFALDDQNKIIGLNTVQCSSMQFYFNKKKIKSIVFRGKPESTLIPPKEIILEDMKLERFEWKVNKKPSKESILSKTLGEQLKNAKYF
ncbi:OstA-like protein [Lacihabitans sp. LS3-19]|uniref:OstA-like protein n=1 Tax=Lacihabitans sp. LS3-19 TaxID=2487335 RepID=UPI0020CE4B0D|nr:OstA-like protein [Lacihabitans sp. LS3-19]